MRSLIVLLLSSGCAFADTEPVNVVRENNVALGKFISTCVDQKGKINFVDSSWVCEYPPETGWTKVYFKPVK